MNIHLISNNGRALKFDKAQIDISARIDNIKDVESLKKFVQKIEDNINTEGEVITCEVYITILEGKK